MAVRIATYIQGLVIMVKETFSCSHLSECWRISALGCQLNMDIVVSLIITQNVMERNTGKIADILVDRDPRY